MNFDQLETFLTICNINNFTRAANELNITQPAVTARISSLEQELDCKLFTLNKNKKPILTKEGEIFLQYAKKIVKDMYDAKQALILSKRPKINLGFPPNFPSQLISEALSYVDLEDSFLSIRKGKDSDALAQSVLNNELILAFVYDPFYNKDFVIKKIKKAKMHFIVSKKHPLANETLITKDLLLNETMIGYSRFTKLMVLVEDQLKDVNLNMIEANDIDTLTHLLESGLGFTILPEVSINRSMHDKFSVIPFEILDKLSLELCAVYKSEIEYDPFILNIVSSTIQSVKKLITA